MLGHNAYAYCLNNPVNGFDPSGHSMVLTKENYWQTMAEGSAGCSAIAIGLLVTQLLTIPMVAYPSKTETEEIATTKTKNNLPKNDEKIYTVYKLIDLDGTVQYVGRTKNLTAREIAHKLNPYRSNLILVPVKPNLTYAEARGLEQALIVQYKTLNTANKMNNQINGISPRNPNLRYYLKAAFEVAGDIISNELLNIFGI